MREVWRAPKVCESCSMLSLTCEWKFEAHSRWPRTTMATATATITKHKPAKNSMNKTTAQHVRFKILYISPSRKMIMRSQDLCVILKRER